MTYQNIHVGTHTELGDLLVCEGLIRHFAKEVSRVTFNTQYVAEADELFADVTNVVPVLSEKNYQKRPTAPGGTDRFIWLGMFSGDFVTHGRHVLGTTEVTFDAKTWDREFYRQAGVPFIMRWVHSRLPSLDYPESRGEVLIHDQEGARIQTVTGTRIEPIPGRTVFAWMSRIANAKQVHCIDSSIANLVESMHANGYLDYNKTELFFHRNVRKTNPPTMLAPWRIVE